MDKQPPEIQGAGDVPLSMEASLWAYHHSSDYKSAVLLAVNLGDDADTTAAIVGQLAGAYYGLEGTPSEWVDKVVMRDEILDYADRLFELNKNLN